MDNNNNINATTTTPSSKLEQQQQQSSRAVPAAASANSNARRQHQRQSQQQSQRNNKNAIIKKGFGLRDWMILLRSAKDIAQRGMGRRLRNDMTLSEVRTHDKRHDAWIILSNKVYNITPYLPYHPGGMDIMKGVLGKDATVLFHEYHTWINIDNLIGPLLLGSLMTMPMPVVDDEKKTKSSGTTMTKNDDEEEENDDDDDDDNDEGDDDGSGDRNSNDIVVPYASTKSLN